MSEDHVDDMEGVESTNTETLPLMSADELRVLELYDRLEELQLEIALLKNQGLLSQDEPAEVTDDELKKAEQDLLKSRAKYQIRGRAIENVLTSNPILKAVHAGSNASMLEQAVLPLIERRDALSISLSKVTGDLHSARKELEDAEHGNSIMAQQNVELSAQMLVLAEEANTQKKVDINDPEARQQSEDLEAEMRVSRQRFRIMKGTASAVIAGSGINWARDPKLLEIVMDDDGDDG